MKQTSKTLDLKGKTLTLQTGIFAEQATSAILGRLGNTMVLTTVVMGKNDTSLDYFPLSVEYVERLYAGGRIKGSKWVKREGRPSDEAILTARLIDRSIRPLFPKNFRKDVQIVITVLSVDGENDPDVLSVITTSAALAVSKIPWKGPIGSTRIGVVKDNGNCEYLVNPETSKNPFLDLDIVVSSVGGKTIMIEAEGKQAKEDITVEAINQAVEVNNQLEGFINEFVSEVGETKIELPEDKELAEMKTLVEKSFKEDINKIIEDGAHKESFQELSEIVDKIVELEKSAEREWDKKKILEAVDYVFKQTIRERILKEGKRPDGRAITELREISAQVGLIPRVHGSAVFKRGQTQVLSVATLGSGAMEQLIETAEGEEAKRYIHHYSFPPYSVGETGRMGSPTRREIGHGALAEKALRPVIPSEANFPYVIRIVSETMSSNGSTSQASVCGSTLALMDAGVPIIAPVAGISIGMMTRSASSGQAGEIEKYVLLTDIIGLEDFGGDMDFKVAGTRDGITAIQLDVKVAALNSEMIADTLNRAKEARLQILEKMLSVIPESRRDVSEFAPKIEVIKIPTEKIGEVIGPGGKVIRNIIATTGAQVDVEEDGSVSVSAVEQEAVDRAIKWIDGLTRELQKGEVFDGTVKRIVSFGAFVEVVPGKEGLVHVSEMAPQYVANPEEIVKIGQQVKVRVKEVDDMGRLNLSMLFGEDAEKKEREGGENRPRQDRPRREGFGGSRGERRDFKKGPPRDRFTRHERRK